MPSRSPVPCPGCGREYPADRFGGGRTLTCACAERVGVPAPAPAAEGRPRFIADAMLGGLARWLRALGYDVAYDAGIADDALVRRSLSEGRLLLTRDRRLLRDWWLEGALLLQDDDPLEQLRQVHAEIPLDDGGAFSRCLRCNEALEDAAADAVRDRVPEAVRRAPRSYLRCPACRRVYWEGSHVARMRGILRDALASRTRNESPR